MKALIVDDERLPAKLLKDLIEQYCPEITLIDMLFSPLEAREKLKTGYYDLLFLDVEMPKLNGVELLKTSNVSPDTQVIFTTAYDNYAIDAFKANAIHYIVKPIDEDELINAVRKAKSQLLKRGQTHFNDERISIFDGHEYLIINQKDIVRLEGDAGYTKIILEAKEHLTSHRIGYYEKLLNHQQFVRCHHSHIVNVNKVVRIGKGKSGYIILSNEETIPLAKSKREELKRRIGF